MNGNEKSQFTHDPRGCGFRERTTVERLTALISNHINQIATEIFSIEEAFGRRLAETVVSPIDIPSFDRAAMDGYALRAEETFGSDTYTPSKFQVIGRSRPGSGFSGFVSPGEAVAIATGAPIPAGADAVLPVEFAEESAGVVLVRSSVAPGRHIGRQGEDVRIGTVVVRSGQILRPQHLGLLAGLGIRAVCISQKPRIAIVATGDELSSSNQSNSKYQINDMNSPMLAALIKRDGGIPIQIGPIIDRLDELKSVIYALSERQDIHGIMINGGSSAGPEDHAPNVVSSLGRLLAHGVALRPASPTGFGLIAGKPVLLTPGNPVSCLCSYDFFGRIIVQRLAGMPIFSPYPVIQKRLAHKISSSLGRVDYVRVKLNPETDLIEIIATSGASILSGTTNATGFMVVPADLEGYPAGSLVEINCYDQHHAFASEIT
jgi:molybdopterin molybdotransferase